VQEKTNEALRHLYEEQEKKISDLEKRLNEVIEGLNSYVKIFHKEVQEAFNTVNNRINAPNITWTSGQGFNLGKRMN